MVLNPRVRQALYDAEKLGNEFSSHRLLPNRNHIRTVTTSPYSRTRSACNTNHAHEADLALDRCLLGVSTVPFAEIDGKRVGPTTKAKSSCIIGSNRIWRAVGVSLWLPISGLTSTVASDFASFSQSET
jgi:hypothetical protein